MVDAYHSTLISPDYLHIFRMDHTLPAQMDPHIFL